MSGEVKLTKAQRKLLADVERHASARNNGWRLRDMRRNGAGIALERLGLVERDYPERGPWPGTVRVTMRVTDAGRAVLHSPAKPSGEEK